MRRIISVPVNVARALGLDKSYKINALSIQGFRDNITIVDDYSSWTVTNVGPKTCHYDPAVWKYDPGSDLFTDLRNGQRIVNPNPGVSPIPSPSNYQQVFNNPNQQVPQRMNNMTTAVTGTVTIETAAQLLRECVKEGISPMLWGAPGIGKTEMVQQVAKDLGIGFRSFIASLKQPVDLSGIPVPDLKTQTAIWLRSSDLPTVERDGPEGIFLVDEINSNIMPMQIACMGLIQEGHVGPHYLPGWDKNGFSGKGWIPVGAGNRISDRAAAQRMPSALKNRFAHFNVEPDIDAWAKWASANGINAYLIAFLRFRPELLHKMPTDDANSFPTPRAWVKANRFLDRPSALRLQLVASLVGQGPATELEAFLRVAHSLPTLKEILADPKGAKCPDQPAGKYAAAGLLARSADRKNFGTIVEYASRLGREFEVLTVVDAVKRQSDLTQTATFGTWAVNNQDIRI